MSDWRNQFKFNPLRPLIYPKNIALTYFVKRDLLDEAVSPIENLWQLPPVIKIMRQQQENGSWKYPSGGKAHIRSRQKYDQLETHRILGQLVELYGLSKKHPAIKKAADFLFGFQTEEGDFRGIYGSQFTPNYTAAIMEYLIKAGYEKDPRIEKGFQWLLSIRQNDGGWAIPFRTKSTPGIRTIQQAMQSPKVIHPDRSKPFSHCITGVVLRAFAAHPTHRGAREAMIAGERLKSRFFQPDKYPDRRATKYWTRFTFPFWFTDLLSALDSLSLLGFTKNDAYIKNALEWFIDRQQENSMWKLTITKGEKRNILALWLTLAICRIFKRYYP